MFNNLKNFKNILLASIFFTLCLISQLEGITEKDYVKGEVIVRFKDSTLETKNIFHKKIKATVIKSFFNKNLQLVKLSQGMKVEEAIEYYKGLSSVEYAEPNYLLYIQKIPNDPLFKNQWGLSLISATDAWDISTCNQKIVIAIIDTGIQLDHQDIMNNIWQNSSEIMDSIDNDNNGLIDDLYGWDFVNNDNDPSDDNGHGTHIAGIVGAIGNNKIGVTGICWKVQLMPLKIMDADGIGTVADEIEAISYAINKGAKIINASFGSNFFSNAEKEAIQIAQNKGILYITAAGNGGEDEIGDNNDIDPFYPACYQLDNIISVTAVDISGNLLYFANYGHNSVDIAAPGISILSTVPINYYSSLSGTSMATAFITGGAALVISVYPHLDYKQIKQLILKTVDIRGSLKDLILSKGIVNLKTAAGALIPPSNLIVDSVKENTVIIKWTDNSLSEDGFIVERSEVKGEFKEIGTVKLNEFIDNKVIDGSQYYYRVKAFMNEVGISLASEQLSVITPLKPPTNLSVLKVTSNEVKIGWTDNSSSEDGYIVERANGNNEFKVIKKLSSNTIEFTDKGLKPSSMYKYRVKAYNSIANESEYSSIIEVTTNAEIIRTTGGGGCSISTAKNKSEFSLIIIILISLFVLIIRLKSR